MMIVECRMAIDQGEALNHQSSIDNPQSAIVNPQSAIRNPQSAIRNPQSAIPIHNPKSQSPISNPKISNQQSRIRNSGPPPSGILDGSALMFIKSLTPRVSGRTRAKGADYFRSGGVVEIGGGEWSAHAIVRGTRDYRVDLLRESGTDRFTA